MLLFSEGVDASHAAHAVNLVKLCRLARVFRLLGRMHRPDSGGVLGPEISARLSVMTVVVVDTLLIAALLVNLMGCLWWWCAPGARRGGRQRSYLCIYVPCPNILLFIQLNLF